MFLFMISTLKMILSYTLRNMNVPEILGGFLEKCMYSAGYDLLKIVILSAGGLLLKPIIPRLPKRRKHRKAKLCSVRVRRKAAKPRFGCIFIVVKTSPEDTVPMMISIPLAEARNSVSITIHIA